MDVKGTLKAITLELRRELEGKYDAQGTWQPGDLERRLAAIGIRRDRTPVPAEELPHLATEDREARRVSDAFLQSRADAGQSREAAIAEFVRDAAYTWANRLLALRCMEARSLIDEVILQKDAYGGRSLQHNRLAKKEPERCAGEDEGLFAVLFDEFARRAEELPLLFDPRAPEVALRPSVAALKRCVALLSGTLAAKGQEAASDEVFTAPDALGWTYQYWNTEEKARVFEKVRTKKGSKIEGAEIVPATCIYTEPYMVKFLVQNSLGATWMVMRPDSRLADKWEYFVRGADRAPISKKPVAEITFLDPACGSGHFLIEAFELFYAMYVDEGVLSAPAEICASILERNLYGIDIDERAVQIAALALFMKAKEKAEDFVPSRMNLVATNICLPSGKEHLEAFLQKHPADGPLKPALLAIFEGLTHADELGSLLQIDEPVDRELRHLRDQQQARERKAGAAELFTPRKDEDWSAWKHAAIERLREHFSAEAHESDLAAAFFGEAASKGLSLVDLLARRYDIVAANPPYMGLKNMGTVLKKFVERHLAAGKRDLYSAFILRCLQLASDRGRVSMVTQQSWMFLRSFADLRVLGDDKLKKSPRAFRGVLRETTIEELAHLGPRAFAEIGGEVVNTALFVVAKAEPGDEHRLVAFRVVGARSPEEKHSLLRGATRARGEPPGAGGSSIVSRPLQKQFLAIPESPVCYWLHGKLLALAGAAEKRLGETCEALEGLGTRDDSRFLRFAWEISGLDGYLLLAKGGGYCKWDGLDSLRVAWGHDGERIKAFNSELYGGGHWSRQIRNTHRYGHAGLTYTNMAQGSLGVRVLPSGAIFGEKGPSIFVDGPFPWKLLGTLNCRVVSYILRTLSPSFEFRIGYLLSLGIDIDTVPDKVGALAEVCTSIKKALRRSLPSATDGAHYKRASSLRELEHSHSDDTHAVASLLHALEGTLERQVFNALEITGDDLAAVLEETGTPAGWFPLLAGYDALPGLPPALTGLGEVLTPLLRDERRTLHTGALADLKRRLRALYEAGPGRKLDEEDELTVDGEDGQDEDDESEPAASGARVLIPTETFIEEIAQKLEIHPISVYWLLRELREKEDVVSKPELVRFVEDYMSVLVLRLLGHQWLREVEGHEPLPAWADKEGIIPLMEGTSGPALITRVRARLAEDFGSDRAGAVEREVQHLTGRPLDGWLASDFFKRHMSQFRKRPIAWQLTSTAASSAKRRGRAASQNAPAFSCLVYCHGVDADLLPKLRTQYVGPLRASLLTELGSLEKLRERSADQDARRLELEGKIEELKGFDARLEQVIVEGLASPVLEKIAAKEPLDKWISSDGRARAPETRDALLAQERRYDPDPNDGVRVNIAPLQRAGLLAVDVLAAKDVDQAIADRAAWRADERRWCREGKVPQPGWWLPRKRF